jgi:hypothetical protein
VDHEDAAGAQAKRSEVTREPAFADELELISVSHDLQIEA